MPTRETVFTSICWLVAIYFAWVSLWPFLPPPDLVEKGRFMLLTLAILFFIIPLSQKIEIFQFLTFERRLNEATEKLEEQGHEIRHLQTIQATLTNSLSNVNTNSNVFHIHADRRAALQGVATLQEQDDRVQAEGATEPGPSSASAQTKEMRGTPNPVQELVFLSIDLEIALRVSVGRNLRIYKSRREAKYLTRNQLVQMFIRQYPVKKPLEPSFDYFFQVANAAGHGQEIPTEDAAGAIVIGQFLLGEVRMVPTVQEGSEEPPEED